MCSTVLYINSSKKQLYPKYSNIQILSFPTRGWNITKLLDKKLRLTWGWAEVLSLDPMLFKYWTGWPDLGSSLYMSLFFVYCMHKGARPKVSLKRQDLRLNTRTHRRTKNFASGQSIPTLQRDNTENSKQIFSGKELRHFAEPCNDYSRDVRLLTEKAQWLLNFTYFFQQCREDILRVGRSPTGYSRTELKK